jgi:hypothetical protein|tara:strand:+ start:514 stop:1641 length:1128 start_codon:yes stop_codon:yes gene_type:complete
MLPSGIGADYKKDEAYYKSEYYRKNVAAGNIISRNAKEREDRINKAQRDSYTDTGGLPSKLRYPYSAITEEMDFLKIQIATYTPPGLNLEGLLNVKNDSGDIRGENAKISRGGGTFALTNATASNTNADTALGGRSLKHPKHTIYLPIPRQIQDANSVTYDSSRLDPLEAAGSAVIKQGIENPSTETVKKAFDAIGTGVDLIGENTDAIASAIAGRAIGALGGNVTANSLIARGSGAILNPNLESLFQGVKLRQFPFTFELFPRNAREAEEVKNIIRVLKRSMAARNNKNSGGGVLIKQPDIFQLRYMKGSEEHPFLNKFLPMHLTDMKINYAASGTYSTFYDGTPSHMSVSCSFQEVNPVYQEDYAEAGEGVGY